MIRFSTLFLVALAACNGDDSGANDSGANDSGDIGGNVAPTLAVEGEGMVREGDTVSFTVTLADEDADGVTLTATSSDDSVVDSAAITVEGTGTTRTLTVAGAAIGDATLTLEAVDADDASASLALDVLVVADRTAWTGFTQFSGGTNAAVNHLVAGPEGQIYTSGWIYAGKFVSTVSRWDADGSTAWTSELDSARDAQGGRLVVMPSGDVLFAAQAKLNPESNYQFAYVGTVKPDGSGGTELQRLDAFDGEGGNHTVPGGLDVAADGGYAVGLWAKAGESEGCGAVRVSSTGTDLFRSTLVTGNGGCRQSALLISGDNTLTGISAQIGALGDTNGGGWDSWLVMLDAAGEVVWSDHLTGAADQWVADLATDADGNFYLCGSSGDLLDEGNTALGDRDSFLRKYDASGTVLWTTRWGTAALDGCSALDIGHDGIIYAVGIEDYDTDTAHGTSTVSAFDAEGAQLWSTSMPTQEPAVSAARGIVADGFDLIVGGYTSGSFPGVTGSGNREGWMVRLDRDGAVQ